MALLAALITGCGSEEISSTHRDIAAESLLTRQDLPGRVKVEGGLPSEPCGPAGIFQDNRGRSAETAMFNFDGVRVQEAVGYFPREELAELSFKELTNRAHRSCIGNTMSTFGRPNDTVKVTSPRKLSAGEESALFRIYVVGPDAKERGSVAVPSIRRGRCVSALILITVNRKKLAHKVPRVVASADRQLSRAC